MATGRTARIPPPRAVRPPGKLETIDHRALQSERARFAASVSVELQVACRGEAAMRRELGDAARVFIQCRLYHRLGFVRLDDYARERLGVAGRTLQAAAWLATRLDALPAVSRAYDRADLSWAQARAICHAASVDDEERWLALARGCTVEELEGLARRTRAPLGVAPDPEPIANEIDGEPALRWCVRCPARVRALWRRACEMASRVAGEPLATWRAAEAIAAEAFSGRPSEASIGERALMEALRLARRRKREGVPTEREAARPAAGGDCDFDLARSSASPGAIAALDTTPGGCDTGSAPPCPDAPAAQARDKDEAPAPADAFALDARLLEAMRVIRISEPRIGRLLRVVVDHRLYRTFGYVTLDDYVRERLGISLRKAWALAKVERATTRSDDFARAYREGRLSWVRALTLLPVLDRGNAAQWIARAGAVTVRRLSDEVNWVLEARDVGKGDPSLAPPPFDSRLPSPVATCMEQRRESSRASVGAEECRELSLAVGVQIGACSSAMAAGGTERPAAHPAPPATAVREISDAEISLIAPASVVALLRDVLDGYARPGAARWTALESVVHHVLHHWENTPRHPDPIFARDGWRCTVPACSSRRNLHDHHIRFRSRGGANTRDNRTAVCAAHHLHGLHAGTIRASGTAPSAIEWELGVRVGAPPLLTYVGDRRS